MADETNGNGNGGKKGIAEIIETAKVEGKAIADRALTEAQEYKDIQKTQLWKSIFRVKHDESPRLRARSACSPTSSCTCIRPRSIATPYVTATPWGMGGISFYLFIVLTFTGILLMYYYHPTKAGRVS